MATATRTPTPADLAAHVAASHVRQTGPLSPKAADALARLQAKFPEAMAEQYRIERIVAGLRDGESAVINGTLVTAVSLETAKALTRYEVASVRRAELNAVMDSRDLTPAEFDALAAAARTVAESEAVLREAGCLSLIGAPDPAIVEKVRTALGYRRGWKPAPHLGETATYVTMWSQMELNDLYERVGGTVSLRQVERSNRDGEPGWIAIEISLTIDVAGVGPVTVVTDIEDDPERGYRTDIPVVTVARYRAPESRANELLARAREGRMDDRDADDLAHHVELMAGHRAILAKAGQLDLIGGE